MPGGSIPLHRTKGVNPRLTFCRRCRGETQELILVGANDGVYKCDSGHTMFGKPEGNFCQLCGQIQRWQKVRTLDEFERLPASEPCDECKKEMAEHKKIVAEGGVYWECKDCQKGGVIRANKWTAHFRELHETPAPKPLAVRFTKADCPACTPPPGGEAEQAPPAPGA